MRNFLFLLFIISTTSIGIAQEKWIDNLSFGISGLKVFGFENSGTPQGTLFEYLSYSSIQFNILNRERLNSKWYLEYGLTYEIRREIDRQRISAVQNPANFTYDFSTEISTDGVWLFGLPLTINYQILDNISIGVGPHFKYSIYNDLGFSTEGTRVDGQDVQLFASSIDVDHIYTNILFQTQLDFQFGANWFGLNLFYSHSLNPLYEGDYIFTNLNDSPDSSGRYKFYGHQFGFGIKWYPWRKL